MDLFGVVHNVHWSADSRDKCLRVAGAGLFGATLDGLRRAAPRGGAAAAAAKGGGGLLGVLFPQAPGDAGDPQLSDEAALDCLQLLDECADEMLALRGWAADGSGAVLAAGAEKCSVLVGAVGGVAADGGAAERVRCEAARVVVSVVMQALEALDACEAHGASAGHGGGGPEERAGALPGQLDRVREQLCGSLAGLAAKVLERRGWHTVSDGSSVVKKALARAALELQRARPGVLPGGVARMCEAEAGAGNGTLVSEGGGRRGANGGADGDGGGRGGGAQPSSPAAAAADALSMTTKQSASAVLRVASDAELADPLTRQLLLMLASRRAAAEPNGGAFVVDENELLECVRARAADGERVVRTKLVVAAQWAAHASSPAGAGRDGTAALATLAGALGALEDLGSRGGVAPRAYLAALAEAARATAPLSRAEDECVLALCRAIATDAALHPHLLRYVSPLGADLLQRVLAAANEHVIKGLPMAPHASVRAAMRGCASPVDARSPQSAHQLRARATAMDCLILMDAVLTHGEGISPAPALAALAHELRLGADAGGAPPSWEQCCAVLQLSKGALAKRGEADAARRAVLSQARAVCRLLSAARFADDVRVQARRVLTTIDASRSSAGGALLGAYAPAWADEWYGPTTTTRVVAAAADSAAPDTVCLLPADTLSLRRVAVPGPSTVAGRAEGASAQRTGGHGDASSCTTGGADGGGGSLQLGEGDTAVVLDAYMAALANGGERLFELDLSLAFGYDLSDCGNRSSGAIDAALGADAGPDTGASESRAGHELPADLYAVRLTFEGQQAPGRASSHTIALVRGTHHPSEAGATECDVTMRVQLPVLRPHVSSAAVRVSVAASDECGRTWEADTPLHLRLDATDFFHTVPQNALRSAFGSLVPSAGAHAKAVPTGDERDDHRRLAWLYDALETRARMREAAAPADGGSDEQIDGPTILWSVKEIAGGHAGAARVLTALREYAIDRDVGAADGARCLVLIPPRQHLLLRLETLPNDLALARICCDSVPAMAELDSLLDRLAGDGSGPLL